MIDYDVSMRRNCEPYVDLESGAVSMLVTRSYHRYAATRNTWILCFQPFHFI